MRITLSSLERELKLLLSCFVIVALVGVSVGIGYLYYSTGITTDGAVERYNGSKLSEDEFEIPESYPKSIEQMLITTHSHVLIMGLIFLPITFLFYFNDILKGRLKSFLLIEPFISILLTFGGIWLMRFIHEGFVYVSALSAIFLYISFYVMSTLILVNLLRTNR